MSKSILTACVRRMKGLSGKPRDEAAQHFLAGAAAADPSLFSESAMMPAKYVDVLEALAEAVED